MTWALEIAQDSAANPHVAEDGRHRLTPEQLILTVVPTLVVTILSPIYLRQYYNHPVRELSGRLLSLKLVRWSASSTELKLRCVLRNICVYR